MYIYVSKNRKGQCSTAPRGDIEGLLPLSPSYNRGVPPPISVLSRFKSALGYTTDLINLKIQKGLIKLVTPE